MHLRRRRWDLSIVIKQNPALGSPSELPRVAMLQPADTENRDDLSHFSRLDRPHFWSVLCESEMRSVLVVVVYIQPDHSPKLTLIDRDHMVQAISS